MNEHTRSRALDAWDYQAPFRPFHIAWSEGEITPAFDSAQAYAIVEQELHLSRVMEVWAHREVLVTFSSEHIQVGNGPAVREPAWVVMVVGIRPEHLHSEQGLLAQVRRGGGAVLQALVHARSGEVLLGTAVPVELRKGT